MRGGLAAAFDSPDAMLDALRALRAAGYRRLGTCTPFPVPAAEEVLRLERSRLPLVIFAGGVAGGGAGYWIQWFANAWAYPLVVGGRPLHSAPAFIPAAFEGAVLGAALAGFVALLLRLKLPALWHPLFEVEGFERATIDQFWIVLDAGDPKYDPELARRALESLRPSALRVMEESG